MKTLIILLIISIIYIPYMLLNKRDDILTTKFIQMSDQDRQEAQNEAWGRKKGRKSVNANCEVKGDR